MLVPSHMAFEPPTDVYETEEAVIVRLEIAGLRGTSREVSIQLQDDVLAISGERPDPASGSARRYEQMEIETGSFRRTVRLPCPVDETAAVGRYEDGFLLVQLPKLAAPHTRARTIRIE